MIDESKKNRIEQLVSELNEHNRRYYVENSPTILDYEFDMLMKELESLENETGYILPYSPTQRVGSDLQQSEFKEVTRKRIMGSIANCYDRNELIAWLVKFSGIEKIAEPKYDGTSCSIIYRDGVLAEASTRGNGYKGADITENVKTIKNVPLQIPYKEEIEVRGEILLPKSQLKRINLEREASGLQPFANERNAAAGSIKQLDTRITASRNLIFKPYGVYCDDETISEKHLKKQSDMLLFATSLGFGMLNFELFTETNDVIKILDNFENNFLYKQDYRMDGIVIKINDFEKQTELGYTQKVPHWAKAFKFKQEQASTKLKAITMQIGMSGQISFVAELEPIDIDGTTVSKATLNNVDFIKENDIKVGSYLFISKGGAVIPRVDGVDYERTLISESEVSEFIEPSVCPFCGQPLSRKIEDGAHLYCTNKECDEVKIQKLIHFAKKECMNIDGLSEKSIRKLYECGCVKDWWDFFGKSPLDFYSAGLGKVLSEKIVDNLKKSVETLGLDRTIVSLGIPMIGKVSAEKIANTYKNIDSIMDAVELGYFTVDDLGDVATKCFCDFFKDNATMMGMAAELLPNTVKESSSKISEILSGMKILATGNLKNYSREGIKQSIVDNGGTYGSGVNKTLTYLIVGSDAGPSKLEKANELGIKMLSESEYIEMIGGLPEIVEPVVVETKKEHYKSESVALF